MRLKKLAWVLAAASLAACDSPLDTEPTASIPDETALNTANNIRAAIRGSYDSFDTDNLYNRNATVYPDLYADNLQFTGTFTTDQQVWLRAISSTNGSIGGYWGSAYVGINRVNNILAAIPGVTDFADGEAALVEGEARFIRALHYFNLVRAFGGVPLVLQPTRVVGEEQKIPRNTAAEVYAQIEADLTAAVSLLPSNRPPAVADKEAANALLSRVYLEQGKYAQTIAAANAVIGNTVGGPALTTRYRDIWSVENTAESLFELQYTVLDSNSQAFWYFPTSQGGRRGYAPTDPYFASFGTDTTRRNTTIGGGAGARFGRKYFRIAGDDNIPVLRRAELYLNRAEANARLGAPVADVLADINVVRARANQGAAPAAVPPLTQANVDAVVLPAGIANTETNRLLWLIAQERRAEFGLEGYRFWDLRRLGFAQAVLGIEAFRLLWPIPEGERDVNPQLDQNPGY